MISEEMRARFAGARVAHLATATPEGHPHVVPMTFAADASGIYSAVDHKPKRTQRLKRLANIAANPQVSVLVDHYEDDWERLWWVRADGMARVLDDGDEFDVALRMLVGKYDRYARRPPAGPVIAIDVVAWSGWSAE